MKWYEIGWQLRQDEMIKSCGCDGLIDSYYSLKGLVHMSELGVKFILEVLNKAIDGRNRYCGLMIDKYLKGGKILWNIMM